MQLLFKSLYGYYRPALPPEIRQAASIISLLLRASYRPQGAFEPYPVTID